MKKSKMVLFLCAVLALVGCKEEMRTRSFYQSEKMKGITSTPSGSYESILILLHGVGSNESDLIEVGERIAPDSMILSLRAPMTLGTSAFAWFQVQFTASGPIHDWDQANQSFLLLEEEIKVVSKKFNVPLSKISVMGFSQGSIMTMGLALKSTLNLNRYLCFSGRTLPEFASFAQANPEIVQGRKVFLTHGSLDPKLPIIFAENSKSILDQLKANVEYFEFNGGHEIPEDSIMNAAKWFENK